MTTPGRPKRPDRRRGWRGLATLALTGRALAGCSGVSLKDYAVDERPSLWSSDGGNVQDIDDLAMDDLARPPAQRARTASTSDQG